MNAANNWAKGYARQAGADFETWSLLQGNEAVPTCHKLLFLQMACEKLTKAHLCQAGSDPQQLQTSHAYVAKNLPIVLRQQMVVSGANLKGAPGSCSTPNILLRRSKCWLRPSSVAASVLIIASTPGKMPAGSCMCLSIGHSLPPTSWSLRLAARS